MSSSPTLACSRWCSSSRASGARLFSPAWPAARNWSRHWEARAAVMPNSRDTDSRFLPRSRRSTVARLRRAENRPFRSRSAAGLVALRALSAAVSRQFFNLLPYLDTPPARTLSQSSVKENSRAQEDLAEIHLRPCLDPQPCQPPTPSQSPRHFQTRPSRRPGRVASTCSLIVLDCRFFGSSLISLTMPTAELVANPSDDAV